MTRIRNYKFQLLMTMFLIASWITSSGKVLPVVLPAGLVPLVNMGVIVSTPLLLFMAVQTLYAGKQGMPTLLRRYLVIFALALVVLGVYGVFSGNAFRIIVFDLLALAPLLGGLVLGSEDETWKCITPVVCLMTMLSIALAVIYTDSRILQDRSIINQETGTSFETVLTIAPILAAVAAGQKRNRWFYPLMLASLGILFVYLYFGRRGISLRATLEIIAAGLIVPALTGLNARVFKNLVIMAGFGIGLLLFFPFDLLINRYQGNNGVVATVTVDNERWYEGGLLWDDLSAVETLVGRGLGGAFSLDEDHGYTLEIIEGDQMGKFGTHMGALWPLLKGGFFFAFFYFVPSLFLLGGITRIRQLDPITRGVTVVVPIWIAFQFIDGSISYSQPWMGFGTGLLLSRFCRVRSQRMSAPVYQVVRHVAPEREEFAAVARLAR